MVIMTSEELVSRLKALAARKTFYKNAYPYNLCLVAPPKSVGSFRDCRKITVVNFNPYETEATSADCVNLLKALFNGYNVNDTTVGYFQASLKNTGEFTEKGLIEQCSDVSSDFTRLKDGEPRVLYMPGHIGTFIGTTVINGKTYNVIECTASFGGGIVYSYVSNTGGRYSYKGGTKKENWAKHGLPDKWVKYTVNKPVNDPKPTQKIYYVKSGDTLSKIAEANGMSLAKLVSLNPQIKNIDLIHVGDKVYLSPDTIEKYYTVQKGDILGTIARKFNISLNKLLGLNPDIKNPDLIHPGDKIRVK